MRDAVSSAAQLPCQVAAGLTDRVVNHAEGLWPGHRDKAPHDPSQLYHENSIQMRHHEQQYTERPAAAPQGEGHENISHDVTDVSTPTLESRLEKAEEGRSNDPGFSTILSRGTSQGASMSSSVCC